MRRMKQVQETLETCVRAHHETLASSSLEALESFGFHLRVFGQDLLDHLVFIWSPIRIETWLRGHAEPLLQRSSHHTLLD